MAAAVHPPAIAESWRVTPSIAWESTFTDNVNLAPANERRSDWINQFTPSVRFAETGAHTHFAGAISLPVLLYARTPENNYVTPQISISGTTEAIEKFLFVDATANVSQQYQSPLGALPNNLANATSNRYTSQSYTIAPYIRGVLPNNIDYELRDSNMWGVANGVVNGGGGSYVNELTGHITRAPAPLGWSFEIDRSHVKSENQPTETTAIARMRSLYLPDPTVELSASVGYENNDFALTQERGVTYGIGGKWHPTDRTNFDASWEHRFFGGAYHVTLDHRTPLSVWSIRASRDITNYPAQLASLPGGGNVPGLLDALLLSKVPDPVQRQLLVDQIIHQRGLPTVLPGPVTLFAQQITLEESLVATFGILGARNSVLFTVFRSRNEPVPGTDLGEVTNVLQRLSDTTQTGAGAVWNHQFASDLTWATSLTFSHATTNQEPREVTDQYTLSSTLSRQLSPFTSIYGGARFQDSRSDIAQGYREFAVFVGASYIFH